jgi:MFS family permease
MKSPFTGLWKRRDFVYLWVGQTVSKLGNGITSLALPLTAVLVLQASPVQMGILSALEGLSVLLVGLLAGVWVDRLPRRPVLIATDLGRATLLLWVPVAAILGVLRVEQLYLIAALIGVLTLLFQTADHALLPTLIRPDELVEGNSKLGASDSVAEIGGLSLAGVLVQAVTAPLAILFDVGSFLVSAWCIGRIRLIEPPPSHATRQTVWREMIEGFLLLARHPLLRVLAGSAFLLEFFGNFFAALYSLYVVRVIGAPPIILGCLIAAGGIGALVGAFVEQRAVRRFGLGRTLVGARLAHGLLGLLTPLAFGPVGVAVALLFTSQLVGDLFYSIYAISEVSLRQSLIPSRMLGRANASIQVFTSGLGSGGALLAGLLGQAIGIRLTLLIAVLGFLLISCWLVLSPLWKVHPEKPLLRREL